MLRKLIFWPHLVIGLLAGVIILVFSVTGVLLMYENPIIRWSEWDARAHAPAGVTQRMPIDSLVKQIAATDASTPQKVTVYADPKAPVLLNLGREKRLFVNAYTGAAIDGGSPKLRDFFEWIVGWHRWLGRDGQSRVVARTITGACNLAALFLILSGLYLWVPAKWTKPVWKAVTIFRPRARGKARDWNWHTVLGFYATPVLLFISLTGVVIGYPSVNDAMFRFFGTEPPSVAAKRVATTQKSDQDAVIAKIADAKAGMDEDDKPAAIATSRRPASMAPAGESNQARRRRPVSAKVEISPADVARLWTAAEQHQLGWTMISTAWPMVRGGKATFVIDTGSNANGTQPMARHVLVLDAASNAVIRADGWAELEAGKKARAIVRFGHTGEFLGFFGQTIAGLASFILIIVVYTGFALSYRRFFGKKKQKNKRRAPAIEKAELQAV